MAMTIVSHSLYCSCETTMHMVYISCTQCEFRLKSLRQEYVRQVNMVGLVYCLCNSIYKIGPLLKCVWRLDRDNIHWNGTKTLLLRESSIMGTHPRTDYI